VTKIPDWARALGAPLFVGRIRSTPSDFDVTELLDIDFSGDGEHDWLYVEKTGANTHWVAEQLSKHASVRQVDVGYAGLKDRHAVTRQWFSVRRPSIDGTEWNTLSAEGVSVLETRQHRRKLKRGAHRGNAFRIAVRSPEIADLQDEIDMRLRAIRTTGVPNYFGQQRFGRDGANVQLGRAIVKGKRAQRHKRSIGISALRSYRFNEELDVRVRDGNWNVLLAGDVANLDGTNSIFHVDDVTEELVQRCRSMDIHPTGELPALEEIGVDAMRRPLRMRVGELEWNFEDDELWLEFSLGKGSYATTALRELVCFDAGSGP
jgi:tRNA pseudouridine13 synthase